ncbi:hypothetical protein C922_05704 [Plasmodium inui San Antonio 1]|uniref:Uncharacterized protein n=1 Tax=Plasmodium inui San Antonio 1 TaxID=1237626 RepID=W6ZXC9_9APIC|nr:hypothetical protein C922_05704 [Plasmodium inui San Antonio 1]EUD63915.1 hypothetical protein C922_05704 [Plasmodium inui San Antonio 1]
MHNRYYHSSAISTFTQRYYSNFRNHHHCKSIHICTVHAIVRLPYSYTRRNSVLQIMTLVEYEYFTHTSKVYIVVLLAPLYYRNSGVPNIS